MFAKRALYRISEQLVVSGCGGQSKVTHTSSRLDTKCGGSPLLGQHFQPLANTAPRGAQAIAFRMAALLSAFTREVSFGFAFDVLP